MIPAGAAVPTIILAEPFVVVEAPNGTRSSACVPRFIRLHFSESSVSPRPIRVALSK